MKIIIILLLLGIVFSAPQEDRVMALDGYYDFSEEFKMYSGYLQLQEKPLISAHYVFITSKNKPPTDDLVLWLNGGPGCSSMLGFLQQFGPHVLNQGSDKLAMSKNIYSWNNKANLLFIESPPGVGFSINQDKTYMYNDSRTASDNLQSLKIWFKKFPQFKTNRFWISGQSYCGMYIPQLADQILKNKDNILDGDRLDFKGMLIGNAAMDMTKYWRRKAKLMYYDTHYFFGPQIKALLNKCKWNSQDDVNPSCNMGVKLAYQAVSMINPYNSIGICYPVVTPGRSRKRYWYSAYDKQVFDQQGDDCSSDDEGLIKFFNNKNVQTQLHVKSTVWTPCNDYINQNYVPDKSSIHLFKSFKDAGLKVLLYSGNVDAQVSYLETQEYIKQIGQKLTKPKVSIKNERGSLQGWWSAYENIVFYVINAAGHMVPCEKPHASQRMFQDFISGKFD